MDFITSMFSVTCLPIEFIYLFSIELLMCVYEVQGKGLSFTFFPYGYPASYVEKDHPTQLTYFGMFIKNQLSRYYEPISGIFALFHWSMWQACKQ